MQKKPTTFTPHTNHTDFVVVNITETLVLLFTCVGSSMLRRLLLLPLSFCSHILLIVWFRPQCSLGVIQNGAGRRWVSGFTVFHNMFCKQADSSI